MGIKIAGTDYSFSKDITKAFVDEFTRPQMVAKQFWGITTEDAPYFEYIDYGNFGAVEEWAGQVPYDEVERLNWVQITPTEYCSGYMIDHNTWRWAKAGNTAAKRFIMSLPKKFGYRFHELIEEAMHEPFNSGFDGTVTTLDAVTLFSASHKPDSSQSSSNSNLLTAPMSQAAIEAARLLGKGSWVDDRDKVIVANLTGVVCDATKESEARVLTGTEKIPSSAYNDDNFLTYYGLSVHPSVRMSSANNWFMIDKSTIKDSFLFNQNRNVDFGQDEDFDTKYYKFSGDTMFAKKVINPYCIVGMNVDG